MPFGTNDQVVVPGKTVTQNKWLVRCGDIELKLTLNEKWLAKPISAALIKPFLGAYAKKVGESPLEPEDVARVHANGLLVSDLSAPVSSINVPSNEAARLDLHLDAEDDEVASTGARLAALESDSADETRPWT